MSIMLHGFEQRLGFRLEMICNWERRPGEEDMRVQLVNGAWIYLEGEECEPVLKYLGLEFEDKLHGFKLRPESDELDADAAANSQLDGSGE